MYTRHMNIPKNYNGVRFSGRDDGISVKEHRPIYTEGVKTAHSPLYRQEEEAVAPSVNEEITDTESAILLNEGADDTADTDGGEGNITEEAPPDNTREDSIDTDAAAYGESPQLLDKNASSLFPVFPVKEILDGINKEDAILVGLIYLIASEKNRDNNMMLTMLALLLLS